MEYHDVTELLKLLKEEILWNSMTLFLKSYSILSMSILMASILTDLI